MVALWLAAPASAQTIDAFNRGWYANSGNHDDSNDNTFTGVLDHSRFHNSFFTFDLSPVTQVSSGILRLELEAYLSSDPSENFTVFGVVTDVPTLNASNSGRIDIFEDLESGAVYGTGTATPSDVRSVLEIPLSGEAIAEINAAAGGLFAVGVHLDEISSGVQTEAVRWSRGSESRTHQLVLVPGPPPCFVIDAIDDQSSVINDGTTADFFVLENDECSTDTPISVVAEAGDLLPDRGGLATTDGATVSYTPAAGFVGFEEFTYTAQDAGLDGGENPPTVDQDNATVVVNVLEDITPDALDDLAVTSQEQDIIIDVLGNDSLGNAPNEVAIETEPANGSATLQADDTIQYSPNFDFFGEDSFEYRLTDTNGDSDVAIVTVGVFFVSGQVPIDIMPNSDGNNLNLRAGQGAGIDIAILSVGEFFEAPNEIDPLTLKFGPREANTWGSPQVRDVDGDGDEDLVVKFLIQQTGIPCGDTHASLFGRTFDFQSISGMDTINTFNCPRIRKRH
jgi:hypothetical protein